MTSAPPASLPPPPVPARPVPVPAQSVPIPAPPQGPGVYPPFPAPPSEGRGRRIGLGLGIGGAVLVLVCGGGVAAAVGLVTVMGRALNEQAHVVVGDFFNAVKAKRYNEAYNAQCQDVKDQETQAEFANRISSGDPIANFTVGDVNLASVDLAVPVQVTYTGGSSEQLQVHLGQNRETGAFQVCGIEE
jgi:hypothetical protein